MKKYFQLFVGISKMFCTFVLPNTYNRLWGNPSGISLFKIKRGFFLFIFASGLSGCLATLEEGSAFLLFLLRKKMPNTHKNIDSPRQAAEISTATARKTVNPSSRFINLQFSAQ